MQISVSNFIAGVAPSVTLALTAKAKELKGQGIDVVSFTAGEPDFDTPEHIRRAAADAIMKGGDVCHYTASAGMPELKKAICASLKRNNNLSYEPKQVLVSVGAKHSVFNAIAALVNPGDDVLVPAPYWVSYPEMVKGVGGNAIIVDCGKNDNFCPTPEQLKSLVTPKTKVLILNSPGNPTGGVFDRAQYEAIYAWLADTNIVVISDEIYEHLVYDGAVHTAPAALSQDAYDRTITINGMSKAFAMTGWRVGYAAGPQKIISAMDALQGNATSNVPTVCQLATIAALEGPMEPVYAMRKQFDARRRIMAEALNAMPGVCCVTPRGAFYAFPDISEATSKGGLKDGVEFCERLLSDEAVALVPGEAFGAPGFVRLSYATSEANIRKGMERLHRFCAKLCGE